VATLKVSGQTTGKRNDLVHARQPEDQRIEPGREDERQREEGQQQEEGRRILE